MSWRTALLRAACGLAGITALFAFQRPFRELPGIEYDLGTIPLPPDYQEKTEWAFARLMFPPGAGRINGYYGRDAEWHTGYSLWSQDFPRADRHFSLAVRRLSRIHVRSVEQLVNFDEGDAYDWPWLYAVQVGEWGLTDAQAKALREYCERGGFFMADDFHGINEWQVFEDRIRRAFPDKTIEDVADDDPIFHTVYNVVDKPQVPGWAHLRAGYKNGPTGIGAHWKCIRDAKGRVMVAISYNSDIGDAWEYADDPNYPAKFADESIRLGVNYIVYSMTH
ncbi:MAG TPA: DUF4159 domain-containing protein [Bryobacteraceae bacterium]|jgi:hypothetical protein|nr:DUF4159 domain-containing protein [Bryobacteraceae bacterium]